MDTWKKGRQVLASELAKTEEKIAATVFDLARVLCPDGADLHTLQERSASIGLASRSALGHLADYGIAENGAFLASLDRGQRIGEIALLCRILAKKTGLDRDLSLLSSCFEEEEDGEEETTENRVIYLKNPYSDQAFLRFSEQIPSLCADYAQSFSQVCEAVYDGGVKYAILPLEDNISGTIPSFRTLRRRHRLKIVMSCDIASGEGEVTRFALLQATLGETMTGVGRKDTYLRFTLSAGEPTPLCEILSVAQECGLSLYKIDSIPAAYADDEFYTELTLRGGGDVGAFLVYLQLFVPGFEIVGYYRNCSHIF